MLDCLSCKSQVQGEVIYSLYILTVWQEGGVWIGTNLTQQPITTFHLHLLLLLTQRRKYCPGCSWLQYKVWVIKVMRHDECDEACCPDQTND